MNRLSTEAFFFACSAHGDQKYGALPYHSHLMDVYFEVSKRYANHPDLSTLQVIAHLHDILEDTPVTSRYLYNAGYSEEVVKAVVSVTKSSKQSYEEYINQVKANHLGLIVKKCDSIANLKQSLEDCDDWRVNKYCRQLVILGGRDNGGNTDRTTEIHP